MRIGQALQAGIDGVNRNKRMWFWFYGVTTIWALLVAGPVIGLLLSSLGNSAWAEEMAGNFDFQWIAELIAGKTALPLVPVAWIGVMVFAVASVAHLFLLGGAVPLFCGREEFSTSRFFENCGRNFWRFVRLSLCAAPLYVVVLIIGRILAAIGEKIWGEGSVQAPLVYWGWARLLVLAVLAGLVMVIVDYARIGIVVADSRKSIRSTIAGVRFVFGHFRQTVGLNIALWMAAAVITVFYWELAIVVPQSSLGLVILLFAIRQATVVGKIWVQLLFYSSQTELFVALAPRMEETLPGGRVSVMEDAAFGVPVEDHAADAQPIVAEPASPEPAPEGTTAGVEEVITDAPVEDHAADTQPAITDPSA
jgi:hypothetical protein